MPIVLIIKEKKKLPLVIEILIFAAVINQCHPLCYRGVRYHEPEYWKFGETGNKYFRHATGQLYAVSKDLATYISVNQ